MSTSIEADPFRAVLPYYFLWKKKKTENERSSYVFTGIKRNIDLRWVKLAQNIFIPLTVRQNFFRNNAPKFSKYLFQDTCKVLFWRVFSFSMRDEIFILRFLCSVDTFYIKALTQVIEGEIYFW